MSSRTDLELIWQARAKSAQRRYEEASRDFSLIAQEFREGLNQSPDGGTALRLARQRESLTLNEYLRTLQIYADLVLKGILPEEPSKRTGLPHKDIRTANRNDLYHYLHLMKVVEVSIALLRVQYQAGCGDAGYNV